MIIPAQHALHTQGQAGSSDNYVLYKLATSTITAATLYYSYHPMSSPRQSILQQ